jgi:hypothetical protein
MRSLTRWLETVIAMKGFRLLGFCAGSVRIDERPRHSARVVEVGSSPMQAAATSEDCMEDWHESVQVKVVDHAKGQTHRPVGDREQIRETDDDRGGTLDVEKGRRRVPVVLKQGI